METALLDFMSYSVVSTDDIIAIRTAICRENYSPVLTYFLYKEITFKWNQSKVLQIIGNLPLEWHPSTCSFLENECVYLYIHVPIAIIGNLRRCFSVKESRLRVILFHLVAFRDKSSLSTGAGLKYHIGRIYASCDSSSFASWGFVCKKNRQGGDWWLC